MTEPKLSIRKGDRVLVLSGKDRGKKSKVLRVLPRERRVVVEDVNMVKKHTRPTREMMQGGIIDQEAPIHMSNVMLICRHCGQPSRTGTKILEGNRRVRFCKKCQEIVDRS